ncbi:MAG: hypothetical protein ABSG97_03980 [Sedimentisphaerales bacterium]|jgi:hypothetical protein
MKITKRKIFLVLAYVPLVVVIFLLISEWILFLIRDPKDALIHENWLQLIIIPLYFAVAYSLVFVKGWSRTWPAESSWPVLRCCGIILWNIATVHASVPLCGPMSVKVHLITCAVLDLLFLVRMLVGAKRKETGWGWQVYAVLYIWLTPISASILVDLVC